MKHDYMTDRNWKMEEQAAQEPASFSFLRALIVGLCLIIIVAISAAVIWHHIEQSRLHKLAASQSLTLEPGPVISGNAATTTATPTAPQPSTANQS